MDRGRFEAALTFERYLEDLESNEELWPAVYRRASVDEADVERARGLGDGWKLLALSEDWCGDAVNTLPVVARLAEAAGWDFRVLYRDENEDLMDAHLTNGRSRSIPVVIVYDADFREMGWWGPRPSELQTWVMEEGMALSSPERYKVVRRWYARDRGRTTVKEILDVVQAASR